ncbi:MAG: hypothetical protein IT323_00315 [Anaerolineae bacterium]|nr:hypothetical protein [Anaerolineae bacterium]
MTIDQNTVAELLQLGGQYFLPVAALLRAIYSGIRGKFPEGFAQIGAASLFAGLTAAVNGDQPDLGAIILQILGNTVFMAGLLSFIMTYLLRLPNRGITFDAIVGGVLGLIAWAIWVPVLQNDWPWWTAPLAVAAGAAALVILRRLLRQIVKLVRIATYAIVIGLILVVGAGAILLLQTLLNTPA